MPTYIEHVVTEIVPQGGSPTSGGDESGDKRWREAEQLQSILKRMERQERRLSAGAFDD